MAPASGLVPHLAPKQELELLGDVKLLEVSFTFYLF